jgi:phage terminase large subunit
MINEKRKLLVVRKVRATMMDSIWQEFLSALARWQLIGLCTINKSNLTITFPNGSIALFKGMDDEEKIKSISGVDDIMIEEATEITVDDFNQLNLRMRSKKAHQQITMMFNPISKENWVYKCFFEVRRLDTSILHTTYLNNKFLPDTYIQTLQDLKHTNEAYYKIYCLGEFGTLDKLIYSNWKVEDLSALDRSNSILCMDFGFVNDPTAILRIKYDAEEKTIYILDEVAYKTNLLTNEIADIIKSNDLDRTCTHIVGDSAEPRLIRELNLKGIPIKPAKKGKDSILQGVTWIQQQKIVIDVRCANTITELKNYTWIKDKYTGEYVNKPIDLYNHSLDALRYGVEHWSLKRTHSGVNIKQILAI